MNGQSSPEKKQNRTPDCLSTKKRDATDTATEPRAWVVVNTLPHREETALENLRRQGFDTYCPMIRRRVKHARYVRDVLRPLFPGYIFVHVSRDLQKWRPILSTVGVRTVVRLGIQLSFLDDGFIEALVAREEGGAISQVVNPYEVGQRVRIEGGAFGGLVATIIGMDEKDRLVVLMEMLNRRVKVKVEGRSVTAE